MTDPEKCPVGVWNDWSRHTCNKPVKRDGKCGTHAAADERVARNAAARQAKRREEDRLREAKNARQAELLKAEAAVERVRALVVEWQPTADLGGWHEFMRELRDAVTPTTHEAAPVAETRT